MTFSLWISHDFSVGHFMLHAPACYVSSRNVPILRRFKEVPV